MVDTFTPSLRLRKPEVGANTDLWAPLYNNGLIDLLDDAIASETIVDVTAGNVVLTELNGVDDEARAMFLRVIGTPGIARTINTSSASKVYIIKNDSDATVNIEPDSGTPLPVIAGQITMVYVEGAVQVFEVITEGAYIPVDANPMTLLTIDIQNVSVGDTQIVTYWHTQGDFVYWQWETHDTTTFSTTAFDLLNNAGNWPAALIPPDARDIEAFWNEGSGGGTTLESVRIVIPSLVTGTMQIFKQDASAWGTIRRALPQRLSFVYPITNN